MEALYYFGLAVLNIFVSIMFGREVLAIWRRGTSAAFEVFMVSWTFVVVVYALTKMVEAS